MEMKWTTQLNKREMLMGYKGNSYVDSGYFYAPYVPMVSTPVVLDPNSAINTKGILSRYGKKLLQEGAGAYGPPLPKYRNIDDNWESSQW